MGEMLVIQLIVLGAVSAVPISTNHFFHKQNDIARALCSCTLGLAAPSGIYIKN